MTTSLPVGIDIVSDVVCPWCYLGRARLNKALAQIPQTTVAINWRPYQLDPSIPAGGKDRQTYMMEKFGDAERIRTAHTQLTELGREVDIDFDFDAINVAPNTLDAHRVIRWAATAGPDVQDRVVGRLFALYFEEGADIGNPAVLIKAAGDAGMDKALVETLLATEADRPEVEQEIETARNMGITGVPCFLFEGRYAVMGAQDAQTLAEAISQIAEAKANGTLDQPAG